MTLPLTWIVGLVESLDVLKWVKWPQTPINGQAKELWLRKLLEFMHRNF